MKKIIHHYGREFRLIIYFTDGGYYEGDDGYYLLTGKHGNVDFSGSGQREKPLDKL